MAENKKYNFREHINLGVIVFLVMVFYLTAYTITYLCKEKLAVYEVSQSNISDTITKTGIILRDETLIKTKKSGYVNYYVKDGSRVQNHGTVYTVDSSGDIQKYINELLQKKNVIGEEEKKQIYEDLKNFSDSFSDDNFSQIYETKKKINNDLISYTDTIIADNKEKLEKKFGKGSYVEVLSEDSGLVSFSSDGMEDMDVASLTRIKFYAMPGMKDLRSKEKQKAGSPVYRLVKGQEWQLMVPINKNEYRRVKNLEKRGSTSVSVLFHKDNFSTRASFECEKKKDGYYVVLYFDNYVQRYIDQRYLTVDLLLSETDGLKIPSSSLVKKDVYKIPSYYLTTGSNSSRKNQVNVMSVDKKGEKILTQATVKLYKTEGDNVLITSTELKQGDKISDLSKQKTFTLKATSQLQGVFVVNRGYAVFQPVEILERNEDYCIISSESGNVKLYDRVILNSDTIEENQVIY